MLSAINTITLNNMAEHSTPAGARMPAPSSSGAAGSMPAGPGATGGSLASSSSFLHPASASTVRPVRAAAAGAYRLHIADPLTLAFDDVDGGSGIRNQVDPDVLAELRGPALCDSPFMFDPADKEMVEDIVAEYKRASLGKKQKIQETSEFQQIAGIMETII